MKIRIEAGKYTKTTKIPDNEIWVFGDNVDGKGTGGQACIRYVNGSYGLPSKRSPCWESDCYFSDDSDTDYNVFVSRVNKLVSISKDKTVVFPIQGIGTGLSKTEKHAPRTFQKMMQKLMSLGVWYNPSTKQLQKMQNIIVAGSRNYTDRDKVFEVLDLVLNKLGAFVIVSGLAKGPDNFGLEWASSKLTVTQLTFPAKWDEVKSKPTHEIRKTKYGKKYWVKAGMERNLEMLTIADGLVAFKSGETSGTNHMIQSCLTKGIPVKVVG